jgi:hypothetical protein
VIVSGRVEIPGVILEVARAGMFKRKEWRQVFQIVERSAMGAGGVLEQNLSRPEVQIPLAPSTLARKQREGSPTTALIGKKGRIAKALSSPTSTFRKRQVIMRKKGGVTLRVFFNPTKFQVPGKKDPYTRILQNGRLKSFTTKTGKIVRRTAAIAKAKSRNIDDVASAQRMPGRPVMSYYPGNETKLTPALLRGVHEVLKQKGLSE